MNADVTPSARGRAIPGMELPTPLSSLVGRTTQIEAVTRSLAQRQLVTLTGIRGVGKSRVAMHVASGAAAVFESVAWSDGGNPAETRQRVIHGVLPLLSTGRSLLVMDDLHANEDCISWLRSLLSTHDSLHVLVTSRRRLGIPGERVHEIPPLERPRLVDRRGAGQDESTTLLLERVKDICPDFLPGRDTMATLRSLARCLGGIPGAIEAAASAHHVLSLECVLSLVQAGGADASTVPILGAYLTDMAEDIERVAVDVRRLLIRAASYRSSVTSTCLIGDDAGSDATAAGLRAFFQLVEEHSLVRVAPSGSGFNYFTVPGVYRTVITARAAGTAELADAHVLRDHHLRAVMEHAAAAWFGPQQAEVIEHLNMHRPDIDALMARDAVVPERAGTTINTIAALRYYWRAGGMVRQAQTWLDDAVTALPANDPARARGVTMQAYLHGFETKAPTTALDRFSEGLQLASSTGDDEVIRVAALTRAILNIRDKRNIDVAESIIKEILESSCQRPSDLGEQYYHLAVVALLKGDLVAAEALCRKNERHSQSLGDVWGPAYTNQILALVHQKRGDPKQATSLAREAFDVFHARSDQGGMRSSLRLLSSLLLATGENDRAALLLGAEQQLVPSPMSLPFLWAEGLEKSVMTRLGQERALRAISTGRRLSQEELRLVALGGDLPFSDDASLTSREREIATLIAAGYQNQRIADELFLSRRTVEGHVQRILSRLGFNSRAQIAVWYTQQTQWEDPGPLPARSSG